jgi:hypothetical protein
MKTDTGKFKFTVPESSPVDAGKEMELPFTFDICENESEALTVASERKWSVLSIINDKLRTTAKSNAYQAQVVKYKPSEVSPEDIKERMIRDFLRLGISEDVARKQVDALLAAK